MQMLLIVCSLYITYVYMCQIIHVLLKLFPFMHIYLVLKIKINYELYSPYTYNTYFVCDLVIYIYYAYSQLDIPANIDASNLQDVMETLPDMGKLSVIRAGLCSGYVWRVEWKTAAGDHPQLIVSTSMQSTARIYTFITLHINYIDISHNSLL